MEYVDCDLCGSSKHEPIACQTDLLHRTTEKFFTVVRCCDCGLHFTNPRPTKEEIGKFYASDYSFHGRIPAWRRLANRFLDRLANGESLFFGALLGFFFRGIAARVKPKIQDPVISFYENGGAGKFLDIGCGAGFHAHFWGPDSAIQNCRYDYEVAGVEVSASARSALERSGIRVWPDLSAVSPQERFGLIRLNWSLEHMHSPSDYFSFIGGHLSAEGQALITVPNYDGLLYKFAPDCIELPVHLYHFRPMDIRAYAERYGLTVMEIETFSYPDMYRVSASSGLLSHAYTRSWSLAEAKAICDFLKPFDDVGWGNDMLIKLQKKR